MYSSSPPYYLVILIFRVIRSNFSLNYSYKQSSVVYHVNIMLSKTDFGHNVNVDLALLYH